MRLSTLAPIAVIAAAVAASGCVSMSRSSEVTALDSARAAGSRVSEVRLTTDEGVTVRPEFDGIFRQHVQSKLDECATGQRPLRLEASISRFDPGWWTKGKARGGPSGPPLGAFRGTRWSSSCEGRAAYRDPSPPSVGYPQICFPLWFTGARTG